MNATGSEPGEAGPATGAQYEISRGKARAVIASLAGALRRYTVDGVDLVQTYPDNAIPPSANGVLLAPWPNRTADGRWTLAGKTQQLDITEPSRGHASHGLLRNTGYTVREQVPGAVELSAEIFPQHGYPFHLVHRARYSLDDDGGLRVQQSLTNAGAAAAPVALGAHPFLRLGDVPTEDLVLTVSASTVLTVDERLIPNGRREPAGAADLRGGARVGDLALDNAYTDLSFDEAAPGTHRHTLTAPDGRSVSLWTGAECGYVHVFVTDTFPGQRRAVALEPMTAPANALNSGEGLAWLPPGQVFSARWGIRAELAPAAGDSSARGNSGG
ncbi:aldose 1-epimerase family protein [Arthrobacter sp. zg-Y1171]|uniref:aldose 1-epimerase family protein n=1 Tax=Arthrobacter sp. zg-Y1171 TaxID=2964610 RepID=UPI00210303E5|nr:aldose 1-epimerase family protein [Arthrobacter sp. zg-Y1171]MCQ1996324.1 aldose 1-epimerase family protein [Arthrobacter sp. zg-Y1171]UWX82629.1 aldose 1-epimerase family protein [Arthrobacter sp. zg-Y1171]